MARPNVSPAGVVIRGRARLVGGMYM